MSWIRIAVFPLSSDLSNLNTRLADSGISHRFIEENGQQSLWIAHADQEVITRNLITEFLQTPASFQHSEPEKPNTSHVELTASLLRVPLTFIALTLSLFGFALVELNLSWVTQWTFWDISRPMFVPDVFRDIRTGEFWRIITPVFLHFGLLHIVMNGLWLWILGSKIELVYGKMRFLLLLTTLAIFSNSAQAIASGPIVFGGMSGVVFGLLGFTWLMWKLDKHPTLEISNGLVGFMVAYMLLSTLGTFDWLTQGGEIADTAHISGFVFGLFFAGLFFFLKKLKRS